MTVLMLVSPALAGRVRNLPTLLIEPVLLRWLGYYTSEGRKVAGHHTPDATHVIASQKPLTSPGNQYRVGAFLRILLWSGCVIGALSRLPRRRINAKLA